MELNKKTVAGIAAAVIIIIIVLVWQFGSYLGFFTLLGVSRVEIDPQGYEDPVSGEWRGSFWMVTMSTDFDDQVAGFILQNEDGEPGETFAVSGNAGVISDKTYSDDEVDGNVLIPTAQVMVHITPSEPYYEREMEISHGYYIEDTYATKTDLGGANRRRDTSIKVEGMPFIHYSFADVGGGNWVLHTPFKVDVYKNGDLVESQNIDTVGKTGVYRIPASGEEFVNIIDLGKLDTSGYGCPIWEDILYFSDNHILVRSLTADNLLRYDAGVEYSGPGSPGYLPSYVNSFSTHWFGNCRWLDDSSPAAFKPPGFTYLSDGNFLGWDTTGTFPYVCVPKNPDVSGDIIPYLRNQGVQKVSMPTGFSHLEKVEGNQGKNYLRVYFNYGTKSSLIVVKISTELADTIVWQPQVANFEITDFPDFGDIANVKSNHITIKCVDGAGSAQVKFTKSPDDAPISITPASGTPRLETGESYTLDFDVQNLGTPETMKLCWGRRVSSEVEDGFCAGRNRRDNLFESLHGGRG